MKDRRDVMGEIVRKAATELAKQQEQYLRHALTIVLGRNDWTDKEIAPRLDAAYGALTEGCTIYLDGRPLVCFRSLPPELPPCPSSPFGGFRAKHVAEFLWEPHDPATPAAR